MELSIRKAPLCLSLSMAVVSPHPIKLCHYKSNTMLPAKKVQHSQFLQCRCTELQQNITEQQGYNIYQRNSLIYRHILVLNLHSMFAANIAQLPFWFVTYFIHLPTYLFSSWFLPLTPLFIFHFFLKFVALVSHIYYFSVYFYQRQFHFQTESTASFYIMVLVRLEFSFPFICCSSF